jgi:hypothetical protein
MSCSACGEEINDEEKIMEMPCCPIKYHALCGIQKMAQHMYSFNTCHCACGALIYEHVPINEETDESIAAAVEAIRAKPGAAAEIKMIKKTQTEENKAQKEYGKLLREKQVDFKEAVATHVDAIKNIKTAMTNTIKQTDEFKKLNRIKKRRVILETKFKNTHNASRHQMRKILGYARWGPIWYSRYCTPAYMIRRRFRIRL